MNQCCSKCEWKEDGTYGHGFKCQNPDCQCHQPQTGYEYLSHSHCWDQEKAACGIPLEDHKQCCLCPKTRDEACDHTGLIAHGGLLGCPKCGAGDSELRKELDPTRGTDLMEKYRQHQVSEGGEPQTRGEIAVSVWPATEARNIAPMVETTTGGNPHPDVSAPGPIVALKGEPMKECIKNHCYQNNPNETMDLEPGCMLRHLHCKNKDCPKWKPVTSEPMKWEEILETEGLVGWTVEEGQPHTWYESKKITVRFADGLAMFLHEVAHALTYPDPTGDKTGHGSIWGDKFTELCGKYMVVLENKSRKEELMNTINRITITLQELRENKRWEAETALKKLRQHLQDRLKQLSHE